jgi:nucleoside phosphorylase
LNPIKQSAKNVLALMMSLTPDGDEPVENEELCEQLAVGKVSERDILDAIYYLSDRSAVKTIGDIDGATVLLPHGRFLYYEMMENEKPDVQTLSPGTGVINNFGSMVNSPIQQGTVNSSQTMNLSRQEAKTDEITKPINSQQNRCVVILTALSLEFNAVAAHIENLASVTHSNGTIYEQGIFNANARQWNVAVVEIGAGNTAAAVETERAVNFFDPQVILFVGVAGGIKDVELGDVVAATKVYDYAAGKSKIDFEPRPHLFRSTYRMEQRARAEARRTAWLQRLSNVPERQPKVIVNAIAAGEQVVASKRSETYHLIRSSYGDAVAVEMEGFGFLHSAHINQQVDALVIRGISDLINGKSRADATGSQEIAAAHASAFAFEVLANLS